jgi:hypothetical protein
MFGLINPLKTHSQGAWTFASSGLSVRSLKLPGHERSIEPVKDGDSSKFDKFNKKMERLFKVIPVPLFGYSSEAGNMYGLAKFNLIDLSKKDKVSKPSKLTGVIQSSSKGRLNISLSTELVLNENKFILLSFINYNKTAEYMMGIGNVVFVDNLEEVITERMKFGFTSLVRLKKFIYGGGILDLANYFKVKTQDSSYLVKNNINGIKGGTTVGVGLSGAFDSRDNRYNAFHGTYVISTITFYPGFLGSDYKYTRFTLDARKFFNPWLKHVIAIQATTIFTNREVPFYNLAMMGGESQMRGYYLGVFRDNVLVDGQVEYRMPIWNILGCAAWVGTGRVAKNYQDLALDGLKLSYGMGLRFLVDSKHHANLRFDFGFGPHGNKGTYISFGEAF